MLKDRTILVCDDCQDSRYLLRVLLTKVGAKVKAAKNGEECLRYAEMLKPDVIIVDMAMPDLDGAEVTRRLRGAGFQIPIVMLSAHAFTEHKKAALQAGCNEYLTKPFEFREVLNTLQTFC